jgi:hypothetical protein
LLNRSKGQPTLSGYSQNVDVGAQITTASGAAFPFYLTYYFSVNGSDLYVGGVTNFTGWLGLGLSADGKMVQTPPSDAIVVSFLN